MTEDLLSTSRGLLNKDIGKRRRLLGKEDLLTLGEKGADRMIWLSLVDWLRLGNRRAFNNGYEMECIITTRVTSFRSR
jgi:hypothetical protein